MHVRIHMREAKTRPTAKVSVHLQYPTCCKTNRSKKQYKKMNERDENIQFDMHVQPKLDKIATQSYTN